MVRLKDQQERYFPGFSTFELKVICFYRHVCLVSPLNAQLLCAAPNSDSAAHHKTPPCYPASFAH